MFYVDLENESIVTKMVADNKKAGVTGEDDDSDPDAKMHPVLLN